MKEGYLKRAALAAGVILATLVLFWGGLNVTNLTPQYKNMTQQQYWDQEDKLMTQWGAECKQAGGYLVPNAGYCSVYSPQKHPTWYVAPEYNPDYETLEWVSACMIAISITMGVFSLLLIENVFCPITGAGYYSYSYYSNRSWRSY